MVPDSCRVNDKKGKVKEDTLDSIDYGPFGKIWPLLKAVLFEDKHNIRTLAVKPNLFPLAATHVSPYKQIIYFLTMYINCDIISHQPN